MPNVKPYYTTNRLVEAVELTITFPTSQNTFSYNNITEFLNQELQLNAVPTIMEEHQEYFIFKKIVPVVNSISRYEIPSRAIGLTLRDLKYSDSNGNFYDMSRVAPDDKAFFQQTNGSNQTVGRYYLEGNEIVITPQILSGASGNLNFFFPLRPNQLVRDDRACIIQNFEKTITLVQNPNPGDIITINYNLQTNQPLSIALIADTDYVIAPSVSGTITNIYNAFLALNNPSFNFTISGATINVIYYNIATDFNVSNTTAFDCDINNVYIKFNQLPSTYTDPDTDVTETLYQNGSLVDFLQTNPGHRTYAYDVLLTVIDNTVGRFPREQLLTFANNSSGGQKTYVNVKVGDYICLQNECIIPQIPPELHHALAERAASRILMAMGDREGAAMTMAKVKEMDEKQATLIGSRVESSPIKVFNRNSLLRIGKVRNRRFY